VHQEVAVFQEPQGGKYESDNQWTTTNAKSDNKDNYNNENDDNNNGAVAGGVGVGDEGFIQQTTTNQRTRGAQRERMAQQEAAALENMRWRCQLTQEVEGPRRLRTLGWQHNERWRDNQPDDKRDRARGGGAMNGGGASGLEHGLVLA
jgi:hypothetical protein